VAYIGWLATPRSDRNPATEEELAELLQVDPLTLRYWRKLPGFRDEIIRLVRSLTGDRLPDALARLEDMAVDGSVQHLKLYLDLLGVNEPEREMIVGIKEIEGARLADV